ncbi:MAG TPA: sigma-54 dependent transcriptional regulator, partial [Pseudomonadales bacterium]|nr:sigma-54 dependent transcriptional regulator [Pseudomonadales bacterium]
LFAKITKVAPTEATVLIRGESGTGKELVARALHEQSHRKSGPMISVNCAAIPDSLIESELFGHEKGAFTGAANMRKGLVEAADGGTLFLDEIGELPLEAQARLLRLMQEKEVRRVGSTQARRINVRLVAATHRDLKQLSKEGRFREDLYYRLHVLELRLPPLRERGEDVVELANYLLQRSGERMGRPNVRFTAEALDAIRSYSWPGNVRELENSVERAVILSDGETVGVELLSLDVDAKPFGSPVDAEQFRPPKRDFNVTDPTEELSLEDYFQRFVLEHQEHMTETELAQKLGISRKCLWERRQRLGIPRKKTASRPNVAD